jgi:thioredoxin-related protein
MKPTATRLLIAALALAASSCGLLPDKSPDQEPSPFGPTGVPPELRSRGPAGTPVTPGGNVANQPLPLNITPESDIVFTDPDNPDASLPELSTLLAAPKRGPWEESETIAKQRASQQGKPLLIWFTDSARSPMCKALSAELFSTPEFEKWASEKLVRLRVDSNYRVTDPKLSMDERADRESDLRSYSTALKKRYTVLGQPFLILLSPDGSVLGRYRGYKRGEADFKWGLIKHGEAVFAGQREEWRKGLEKKGYREWSDKQGRKTFAKLTSYHEGTLILIQPDGTRARTSEDKLSDADRKWIADQKKLRGIE